jgi:hypothetical protein
VAVAQLGWFAKLDTDPAAGGGLTVGEKFFPQGEVFRGRRVHQVRLQGLGLLLLPVVIMVSRGGDAPASLHACQSTSRDSQPCSATWASRAR